MFLLACDLTSNHVNQLNFITKYTQVMVLPSKFSISRLIYYTLSAVQHTYYTHTKEVQVLSGSLPYTAWKLILVGLFPFEVASLEHIHLGQA